MLICIDVQPIRDYINLKLVLREKSESLWGIKIKTSGFEAGVSFNELI